MKNRKAFIIPFICVLILSVALLFGCGDSGEDTGTAGETSSALTGDLSGSTGTGQSGSTGSGEKSTATTNVSTAAATDKNTAAGTTRVSPVTEPPETETPDTGTTAPNTGTTVPVTLPETEPVPVTSVTTAPVTATEPTVITTTATAAATTTAKTATTAKTTTAPTVTTAPAVTTGPSAGPEIGTKIMVKYEVSDTSAGKISGAVSQSVLYGKTTTTAVTAFANLGYKFVGWSDGVKDATRSGDCPTERTTYTALFEIDALELPIIMLTTETGNDVTSKDVYIGGTISVLNVDEKYLIDGAEMKIRGRGNYTWSSTFKSDPMYNKRPYRIKLTEGKKLCGIGEGKSKNWVLLADHCDQSLLRNNTVYSFAKSLSGIFWQPAVQSVEVYLNGEYHGVYLLVEQVAVDKNKISVSEDLSVEQIGFLVMYSGYTDTSTFESFTIGSNKYEIKNDFSEDPTLANKQKQYIVNYMNDCWNAVYNGSEERVDQYIDIDSVIDSYIVQELFKNLDTGWDNFYMSRDVGGKLKFGPVWDFDQCAGNADVGVDEPENIRGGDTQPWYKNLLKQTWFKKRLQARWNELKPEIDQIPAGIIAKAEAGYNSYCRNFDRWKIFGYKINRETYVRQFTTYKQHYEYFADFMVRRTAWLDSYWNDPTFAFSGELNLKGRGSRTNPYQINNADDFINFTMVMSGGDSFSGKYFRQTADIDLSTVSAYKGLGSGATFAGIYDGNGYKINVNISNGNDGCVFPYVSGVVMNVITTGKISASGIIAGIARSVRTGGAIINCASFIDLNSGGNVGGIVGSNQPDSAIVNCFFGGKITSGGGSGAINVWYSGRTGNFSNNYYIKGLQNSTAGIDNGQSEEEVDQINGALAEKLNSSRSVAAGASDRVNESDLCTWSFSDGTLVMSHK